MYLTQGLHRALQHHPERTALTHWREGPVRAHRFDVLLPQVACRAAALAAHGVQRGDRVALLAANDDRLVMALYACWWLGAVACPLNVRAVPAELAQVLADCEPHLVLSDEALAQRLPTTTPPVLGLEAFAALAERSAPLPDTRTGGEALAAILYTGGTTGRAKGVMLTHANLWAASITRAAELPNSPDSISLLVAPLFHVAGLGRLVGQTTAGGACVTLAAFKPEAVLAAMEALGIGDIIVVPTMLQALLDEPGFRAERVQSLNRIAFGAAPMPPDLLERALSIWPHAEFFQAYGLTETAGAVCINLPQNHRSPAARAEGRLHSVGRAGLGAEIMIVSPEDPNEGPHEKRHEQPHEGPHAVPRAGSRPAPPFGQELPRGEVGEVWCRGPMVTPGYWRDEAATARAFHGGWFRTGDAGRMGADGTLTIVDRLKDMIISGGENIYSAEVESALRAHPSVAQAAVVGVPHPHWGEAVHAVVVLRELASPETQAALSAWCRTQLAGYKCPRSYRFVAELPLSAAGKVLKNDLREQLRAGAT